MTNTGQKLAQMDAILLTHTLLVLICASCVPFLALLCKDILSGKWLKVRLRFYGWRCRFYQAVFGGPHFVVINGMFYDLSLWHLSIHNGEWYINHDGHPQVSVHIPPELAADVYFEWK